MRTHCALATRVLVAVAIVSLLLCIDIPQVFGQTSSKILMIPREGISENPDLMISMEVGVMTKLLTSAGFTVDIATTSGYPIVGPTKRITGLVRLQDVNVDNYAGIIMPCMAVGIFPGPPVPPEAVALVKKALSDGKHVAAELGAINVLAEAGVLKGKRYGYFKDPLTTDREWPTADPRYTGAIYNGMGIVHDGEIITCGVCPNIEQVYGWGNDPYDPEHGAIKLTKEFIAALRP